MSGATQPARSSSVVVARSSTTPGPEAHGRPPRRRAIVSVSARARRALRGRAPRRPRTRGGGLQLAPEVHLPHQPRSIEKESGTPRSLPEQHRRHHDSLPQGDVCPWPALRRFACSAPRLQVLRTPVLAALRGTPSVRRSTPPRARDRASFTYAPGVNPLVGRNARALRYPLAPPDPRPRHHDCT